MRGLVSTLLVAVTLPATIVAQDESRTVEPRSMEPRRVEVLLVVGDVSIIRDVEQTIEVDGGQQPGDQCCVR